MDQKWLSSAWKLASLLGTVLLGTTAKQLGTARFVPFFLLLAILVCQILYNRSARLQAFLSRLRSQTSPVDDGADELPASQGFRGLLPFRESDAGAFASLGRELAIASFLPSLREPTLPMIVLRGAPGSGKTSLIHAGLVPPLQAQGWQVVYVESTTDTAIAAVRAIAPTPQQPLLVVVDQFEEFFLRGAPPSFVSFMVQSLSTGSAKWLLSVREDFKYLVDDLAEQHGGILQSVLLRPGAGFGLKAFSVSEAQKIIARLSASVFHSGLARQLSEDLARDGKVLPADIQFVGYEMQIRGITTLKDYQRVGGRDAIVATSIKSLIEAFPAEKTREVVRQLLNELIDRDFGTRLQRPLSAPTLEQLIGSTRVEELLQPFLDRRIVIPVGEHGTSPRGYRLAHDYLVQPIYAATERTESELEKLLRLLRHCAGARFRDEHSLLPWRDFRSIRGLLKVFASDARVMEASTRAEPVLQRTRRRYVFRAMTGILALGMLATSIALWIAHERSTETRRVNDRVIEEIAKIQRGQTIPQADPTKYGSTADQARNNELVAFAIIGSDKYNDGEYVEALRYYLAADEIRDVAEVKARIADCFLALGYNDEAIQWEQKAIALAPAWSGPYYAVGIAYWRKREYDKAREYLKLSCDRGFQVACEQMRQVPGHR